MNDKYADSAETLRLLKAAAEDDATAIETLFQRHLPSVKQSIRRRFRPQARARFDASDVIQETHQQARQQLSNFLSRRPMPFELWLLKTAHQRLVDLERYHLQAAKRSVEFEMPLPENSSIALANVVLVQKSTPVDKAVAREQALAVRRSLARLSDADREVLMLRIFDDLSNAEVALVLDQNPETTKKRFARALVKLKQQLRESGLQETDS